MSKVNRRKDAATRSGRAPRPRNPAATREALVDAAARIFNGSGYFATDTNAIAREAGYAPASFYKHFKDKSKKDNKPQMLKNLKNKMVKKFKERKSLKNRLIQGYKKENQKNQNLMSIKKL